MYTHIHTHMIYIYIYIYINHVFIQDNTRVYAVWTIQQQYVLSSKRYYIVLNDITENDPTYTY